LATIDTKQLASTNRLFGRLDEELENLFKIIEDKNIEIKSLQDIERVERYISETLLNSIELIDKSSYEGFIIDEMKKAVIKELIGRFSEKFGLDPMYVITELDKEMQDLFKNALKPS